MAPPAGRNSGQQRPDQPMSPRQRAVEALERRRPPGPVPTCELAFGLFSEWLGRPVASMWEIPEDTTRPQRRRICRDYARDTAEVYRQMGHCIITHWGGGQDMIDMIDAYRHETGDEFMLGFPTDSTLGIPDGTDMEEFVYRLVDDPQAVHDKAARDADAAVKWAETIKNAGADVVWMGSDYAMNAGPFLSPEMFAEFVAPYLSRQIAGFRRLGLYVIKHTDGDITPIMDQIVDANPHAIHSLDSVAGVDIREVKRRWGDRVALIGNVPHGPLQLDRRDQIEQETRYALDHGGVRQGGYILSTSNAVFGGPVTGIDIDAYRFMLSVRDRYMAELTESDGDA